MSRAALVRPTISGLVPERFDREVVGHPLAVGQFVRHLLAHGVTGLERALRLISVSVSADWGGSISSSRFPITP